MVLNDADVGGVNQQVTVFDKHMWYYTRDPHV